MHRVVEIIGSFRITFVALSVICKSGFFTSAPWLHFCEHVYVKQDREERLPAHPPPTAPGICPFPARRSFSTHDERASDVYEV